MDIYIVKHDLRDCDHHEVRHNYFLSLRDALDYAESNYTYHFEFDEKVSVYQLYPEYDYLELIYSYTPPYHDPYAELYPDASDPEDDLWYLMTMDDIIEEDEILDDECEEWMKGDYNLPWDYQTMSAFLRLYNGWGYSRFGHPIYQTSGHKFRAFKWHINNDRESTKLLKVLYQKLSRLYGEGFVDRFIK